MFKNPAIRPYLVRLVITLLISIVFVGAFNEVTYQFQKEQSDRPPQTVELDIPPGTAQRVAAGQDVPSIPSEMTFVVGDTLLVKNEDSVSHQLGPIWVPPGTIGSLVMGNVNKYSYSCSFQASRYLGIDVTPPTTPGIRLAGMLLGAPTMAVLIYMYGLLIFPIKQKVAA